MLTQVRFTFANPDGTVVADNPFTITLYKASVPGKIGQPEVILPEVIEAITDAQGQAIVALAPLDEPYFLELRLNGEQDDDMCAAGARYRFIVPVSDQILEVSTLIVTDPTWSRPWDEEALAAIMDAKASALNSATRAETAATTAIGAADTAVTSATTAVAAKDAALDSQNAAKTSETNAKASETAAAASQTAAADSQNAANSSAISAAEDAANAKTSETNAKASETAAAASQAAALTSAQNAAGSNSSAQTAATNAAGSATAAKTSETNSKTSEDKAKAWATNPEDTAVDPGQFSAFHWAEKARKDAAQVGNIVGPRLTSIANAVLAVNDMLIADSATTMAKIATGANGRLLLSGATPAANRTNLGLGTSAVFDTTTSVVDATPGRVLKVGDLGLGVPIAISTSHDLNALTGAGTYVYASGNAPANSPVNTAYTLEVYGRASLPHQRVTQIYSLNSWIRSSAKADPTTAAADWLPWQRISGTAQIVMVTDLNTLALTGDYTTSAATLNVPTGQGTASGQGYLHHEQHENLQYAFQEWRQLTTGITYSRVKAAGVWYSWVKTSNNADLGNAANATLQAHRLDNTAGRVLTVGAFGMGNYTDLRGTDISLGAPSVCFSRGRNIGMVNGGSGDANAMGIPQIPGLYYGVLEVDGQFADQSALGAIMRSFKTGASGGPRHFVQRATDSATWGSWVEYFTTYNAVGVVNNNVHLSALLEFGNNANGTYLRLMDGTQICWGAKSSDGIPVNTAAGTICTFPVPFVNQNYSILATPEPFAQWDHYGVIGASQRNTGNVNVMIRNGAYGAQAFAIYYLAIGRWK